MIVGGWFVTAIYYGETLLGVVGNYFWNYLILYLALRWQKISTTRKRRFAYTAIITAVGLLIDVLYYEFTWGTPVKHSLPVPGIFETPGLNPGLELSTILIPMALIGIVNYFASRFYLHFGQKTCVGRWVSNGDFHGTLGDGGFHIVRLITGDKLLAFY